MIIQVYTEKTFDKIQYPFIIKPLKKTGIQVPCLSITKAIYNKSIENIVLNVKKLKTFA